MATSHPINFSGKCGTRSFMGMSTIAERSFGCDRGDNVWKHHSENSLPHNGNGGRWKSARSLGMLAAGIGRIRKTAARHSRHASLSDLNTHWAACFYSRQTWIIGRPHLSGSVPGGPESARLADSSAQHTAGQTVAAEAGKLSCPSSGAGVFTAEDNVNLQSPSSQFC